MIKVDAAAVLIESVGQHLASPWKSDATVQNKRG
jgi:hypothetical protein